MLTSLFGSRSLNVNEPFGTKGSEPEAGGRAVLLPMSTPLGTALTRKFSPIHKLGTSTLNLFCAIDSENVRYSPLLGVLASLEDSLISLSATGGGVGFRKLRVRYRNDPVHGCKRRYKRDGITQRLDNTIIAIPSSSLFGSRSLNFILDGGS